MSIDVGFGDAEKFAKGMMLGFARLEFIMDKQMKLWRRLSEAWWTITRNKMPHTLSM